MVKAKLSQEDKDIVNSLITLVKDEVNITSRIQLGCDLNEVERSSTFLPMFGGVAMQNFNFGESQPCFDPSSFF